jgi:restriction system protein
MRNYYRVFLGRKNAFAEEAYKGNFIGAGFIKNIDLTGHLSDDRASFNEAVKPIFREQSPDKKKMAIALHCGMLWTISKEIQIGDIVICPDGKGSYYAGEIIGNYEFHKESKLQHHRAIRWLTKIISRNEMSESLRNSTGSIGTVSNITKYADEIENILSGSRSQTIISNDETVEDPSIFALEKHLEEFLIQNWKSTDIGKKFDIFEEEGEMVGQQYATDTGPIDILAVSKDNKTLLVVELKKGRVSDVVVGQCQRYMGYVKEELAEENQEVRGIIIGFEDDKKIHRALSVTQNIEMYTYKVNFQLEKKY